MRAYQLAYVIAIVGFFTRVSAINPCTPPTPTVTFRTSCDTIEPTDASCWTPHVPTAADSVIFPAGTSATAPPSAAYTPLIVTGVTVAPGASVVLAGGGIQATKCILVQGSLVGRGLNLTSSPSRPYLADPTTPEGTDCSMVPKGFTPRVCGPGTLTVVKGAMVSFEGLYASLFAGVIVEAGAAVTLGDGAFLWGNTTVYGTLTSAGRLYLHGFLFNYGTTYLAQVRSDYWHTFYVRPKPIVVYNVKGGVMNITTYISTDVPSYYGKIYPTYRLSLLNDGTLTHYNAYFGMSGVDIINTGTMLWVSSAPYYPGSYFHEGTAVNYGTFEADDVHVTIQSYTSHNGQLVTHNGGSFVFDNGAGVDEGVIEICRKRRDPQRDTPRRIPLAETVVVRTNISCAKDPCPGDLCCGKDLICETARCHCDYGSGPVCCCFDNAFCGGSSHGPYCGSGFGWEVDTDCMESADHVDRFQFETAMKLFGRQLSPTRTSARQRFSMRGETVVAGTGVVRVGQAVAISGRVLVQRGATLRVFMEHGDVALAGRGLLEIEGTLALGIRTRLSSESASITILNGGEMRIPRACVVQLSASANVTIHAKATLHVDGQLLVDPASRRHTALCGAMKGRGAILGPLEQITLCHHV